jgi:ADP-ribosyl-[dinitrogen reductase] hydrolase
VWCSVGWKWRPELWADTALAATLTHNDAGSTAACLAFVDMLWQLVSMRSAPAPEWWLETYIADARDLEGETTYCPRVDGLASHRGPVWRFVNEWVGRAFHEGWPVDSACERWHSGAYLLETMPSVICILMRHGHDPQEAIVRAVNDTKDNDSIAAIVGAAVGALHGAANLPARWKDGLSGRTASSDDGRIFDLIHQAKLRWWDAEG